MKKIILVLLLLNETCLAKELFEQLRFGMSLEDVKSQNICDLKPKPTHEKKFEVFFCNNFKFRKSPHPALLYFINNKFEKIIVSVGERYHDMEVEAAYLKDEFGSPSSIFDLRAVHLFNEGSQNQLHIAFEKGSVVLKLFRTASRRGEVTLSYSSEEYRQIVVAEK